VQIYNVSCLVCLAFSRACRIIPFTLVPTIICLLFVFEANAASITFSEYPLGTTITNQYQNLGVVFSGEPTPVISTPDYFGSTDTSLTIPANSGSIIVTFIDINDLSPAVVSSFNLSPYYALFGSSMKFTFYDISGEIISQQETGFSYDFRLITPPLVHKFSIETNGAWFWMTKLSFVFAPDHCADELMNEGETGINCGGGCPACNLPETPRNCSSDVK